MSFSIATNTASSFASNALRQTQASLATSAERLSSGKRVNSAKDDAAGLAISSRISSLVRGRKISERNINDVISCLAIAHEAAKNINECQQRIRELAVQAANGTNTSTDRSSLNVEAQQLINAITSFANQAQFNGAKLLNGDFTSKRIQVGPNSTDFIDI